MKILIVNTHHYLGGGDSTYTFQLCELLKHNNIDVFFFAMQDPKNFDDPNDDLFVNNIDFKSLNNNKTIRNAIHVAKRAIFSVEAKIKFSRLLQRVKPDIIHLQNIHAHITPSIIIEAKKNDLPVLWTLHDYKLVCPNTHFHIDSNSQICEACTSFNYFNAVLKKCKKDSIMASLMASIESYIHAIIGIRKIPKYFLSPSNFLRKKLVYRGFNPDKIIHLPLFIPDYLFKGKIGDEGYFLYFGRITPIKGIRTLLDAFHTMPEYKLLIAGSLDESFRTEFFNRLPTNAKYVGMRYGNDLRSLILNSRSTILPSLWYENQPFSITEAFASGKPVIASNLGGMTELIKHRERGFLVPPGDSVALSSAVKWLHENPKDAKRLGANAKEYALEEHSATSHYDRLIQIYERAL